MENLGAKIFYNVVPAGDLLTKMWDFRRRSMPTWLWEIEQTPLMRAIDMLHDVARRLLAGYPDDDEMELVSALRSGLRRVATESNEVIKAAGRDFFGSFMSISPGPVEVEIEGENGDERR